MSDTEARLAALCAAAGYPDELREPIAEATFPAYEPGEPLTGSQLCALAEAVRVVAQAGRTAQHVPVLIAEYKARHGERWREVFWRGTLRTAAFRAAHPARCAKTASECDQALPPPAASTRPEQAASAQQRSA